MSSLNPSSSGNFSLPCTNKHFQIRNVSSLFIPYHSNCQYPNRSYQYQLVFVIPQIVSFASPLLKSLCANKIYILHYNDVMNLPTMCHFPLKCLSITKSFRKIQDLPQFSQLYTLQHSLLLLTYMDPLNKRLIYSLSLSKTYMRSL